MQKVKYINKKHFVASLVLLVGLLYGVFSVANMPSASATSTYTVKAGDYLYKIASVTNTPINTLLSLNNLTINSVIHPGQVLIVSGSSAPAPTPTPTPTPTGGTYTVRSGDCWSCIASRLGISMTSLLQANNATTSTMLYPGQVIKLPGGTSGGGSTGGGGSTTGSGSTAGDLLFIGDSLTYQGLAYGLKEALIADGHGGLFIQGVPGITVKQGISYVDNAQASGGDAPTVVISLGTNDMRQDPAGSGRYPAARYRDSINQMLSAIGGGHRVVWVAPYVQGYNVTNSTFLNVLNEFAQAGRLKVLNFQAWAATKPANYFVDGVHMSGTGYNARESWLTANL